MNIYLIRHGESRHNTNVSRELTTDQDDPLTLKGEGQAIELGQWWIERGFKVDVTFSSPFLRATRTFELAFPNIPFLMDERLIEQNLGVFEVPDRPEIAKAFEQYKQNYFLDLHIVPPDGESVIHHYARIRSFLDENVPVWLNSQQDILIVCHGGTIRLARMWFENLTEGEFSRFFNQEKYEIPNCQVVVYSDTIPKTKNRSVAFWWVTSLNPSPNTIVGHNWEGVPRVSID
jgi:broad specificity phosphatase PhoE